MEGQECRFSYSNFDDSLIISCKGDNENVRNRFKLGNFIFNLTGRGKVVGLQILDSSQVLSDYNLNPNLLNEIKSVNLVINNQRGTLVMALIFSFNGKEGKISFPLLNSPISN